MDELNALDSSVESIIVDSNACNDESFTVLDLTRFVNLRVFEVGDYSFRQVEVVHLIGLSKLERVVIGDSCFEDDYSDGVYSENNQLVVKNCERLRELRLGSRSFVAYSVFDVENVPSLEVIEIGNVLKDNRNFWAASRFELKSALDGT